MKKDELLNIIHDDTEDMNTREAYIRIFTFRYGYNPVYVKCQGCKTRYEVGTRKAQMEMYDRRKTLQNHLDPRSYNVRCRRCNGHNSESSEDDSSDYEPSDSEHEPPKRKNFIISLPEDEISGPI